MSVRVAIVYNEPPVTHPDDHWLWRSGTPVPKDGFQDASENGVFHEVRQIEDFLTEGGYSTIPFAVDGLTGLVNFLVREKPDVVFNCCESFRGQAINEMNVAAVYELLNIPYTGSSALTLGIALHKGVSKALFRTHGISTPPFVIVDSLTQLEAARALRPPLIVKPLAEDGSLGIDGGAVVDDERALAKRVRFVLNEFCQPAMVEEFVDGRELNVGILASSRTEIMTLPISEILFDGWPQGSPRILSYEAKWLPESHIYRATVPRCPAQLDSVLSEQIRAVALKASRAVGLRDYGRIDLRVRDSDNAIFVLEANPNPDITYDSGFIRAAEATGRTHGSTIREILQRAIERMDPPAPEPETA